MFVYNPIQKILNWSSSLIKYFNASQNVIKSSKSTTNETIHILMHFSRYCSISQNMASTEYNVYMKLRCYHPW